MKSKLAAALLAIGLAGCGISGSSSNRVTTVGDFLVQNEQQLDRCLEDAADYPNNYPEPEDCYERYYNAINSVSR